MFQNRRSWADLFKSKKGNLGPCISVWLQRVMDVGCKTGKMAQISSPHSHYTEEALRFLFLKIHTTSYSFYSSVTVHCEEKGGNPDKKLYHLSYGLRNPYRNIKYENSQDYAQKQQRNCTFMNSASVSVCTVYVYTSVCYAHEYKYI